MAPDPGAAQSAASIALRSLISHALGLANQAHGLLERAGRHDLATRLDDEAQRWRGTATLIVVVGEIKRGKSSLVNALLARPGLLPVGVTVPTTAPLAVSWGDEPAVAVERWVEDRDDPDRLDIDLGDLARYASGATGVRRIDVRVPAPVLDDGVVLIDTPGIGSMSAGHRDLVLGLMPYADAVVFVTSAEEPLLRSEAQFLGTAASRVAEIEVVVTKGDLIVDRPEFESALAGRIAELGSVLEKDGAEGAARLRELADRPVIVTSSLLAERAEATADPARARALRERSGVGALHDALRGRVADRTRVRLANVAQTTSVAAALALRGLRDESPDPSPAPLDPRELGALMRRVGMQGQRRLTGELNDVEARYRDCVEQAKDPAALVAELPAELEAALQAVWLNVLAAVDDELCAVVTAGLQSGDADLPDRVRQATGGRRIEAARLEVDLIEHGMPALSATWLIGYAILSSNPVGWAIGAAIGSGSVAVRVLRKAKAKTRQQAAAAVRDAVREARGELASELQDALGARRAALEQALASPAPAPVGAAGVATELARIAEEADALRRRLA